MLFNILTYIFTFTVLTVLSESGLGWNTWQYWVTLACMTGLVVVTMLKMHKGE